MGEGHGGGRKRGRRQTVVPGGRSDSQQHVVKEVTHVRDDARTHNTRTLEPCVRIKKSTAQSKYPYVRVSVCSARKYFKGSRRNSQQERERHGGGNQTRALCVRIKTISANDSFNKPEPDPVGF